MILLIRSFDCGKRLLLAKEKCCKVFQTAKIVDNLMSFEKFTYQKKYKKYGFEDVSIKQICIS